jgi:hypothetical protein
MELYSVVINEKHEDEYRDGVKACLIELCEYLATTSLDSTQKYVLLERLKKASNGKPVNRESYKWADEEVMKFVEYVKSYSNLTFKND